MSDDEGLEGLSKPHTRGCIKTMRGLMAVLACDLYRYAGNTSAKAFIRHFIFTPGYHYTVLMRLTGFLLIQPAKGLGLYYLTKAWLLHARYKYGIAIPEYTLIGPGLFINRFGGIYLNGDVVVGRNVNITHGTGLGQTNRGPLAGSPIIGDRVFMGIGCKVLGRVTVGSDAVIAVYGVVGKDVPPNAVVGGIPAKLISSQGGTGYINRQASPDMLAKCEDAFVGALP